MLVLSRKVGEKIRIGPNISITVVRMAQGVVRIGIEAPDDVIVLREEIADREDQPSASILAPSCAHPECPRKEAVA